MKNILKSCKIPKFFIHNPYFDFQFEKFWVQKMNQYTIQSHILHSLWQFHFWKQSSQGLNAIRQAICPVPGCCGMPCMISSWNIAHLAALNKKHSLTIRHHLQSSKLDLNLLARKLQNENIYIDSIEKIWQKSLVRINFHWLWATGPDC